jgi:methylmalonyl-CoA mutase
MTDLDFSADFPPPDRAEWVDAVEKVLRGRSFEKVLVSTTDDGIDIQPLYVAADAPPPAVLGPVDAARVAGGWDVRQVHDGSDPAECSRAVLAELERGVTSVELTAPATGWTLDTLRSATEGVLLDLAPVALAPHADPDAATALHTVIAERGDLTATGSWLGLDPIGETARGGRASTTDVIGTAAELATSLPNGRTVTIDSSRYGDAGATEAQQIGWSIASAVACLRSFETAGVDPRSAAATMAFRISVGADQFLTMAMVRASRRVWARVLDASGVAAEGRRQVVQAVTSRAMFSRRDPWVNMLRGTTAAFAAGVGGADAVTVLPFDDAIGVPDDFSRRVARNTQLLLIEESHLARIIDPAAGSWFVESLTERLASAAWEVFTTVEAEGGMEAALAAGTVEAEIEGAWASRLAALGTRRRPLTGVSEFPDLDETPVERPRTSPIGGLPVRRLAAPFELLRDAADRFVATTGNRPVVHLAALGDLATHTARSAWVTNLLAVGGIAAVGGDDDGSMSPLEAQARFTAAGASVAVICSSDGVYAQRAAATATALREAGATRVVLAGAPGDLADELMAAGLDEFWYAGIDVLEVLTRLHHDLGLGEQP